MKNLKHKHSVGLALGSGAFRGLAHIGVIKSLQANHVPIDAVSGSSVGALVAAYFALHQEVESLETKILSEKNRKFKLSDFSWRGGFVSSSKFQSFVAYLLGDYNFSKTKIPVRIIATDLLSGLPVIFDKGSLAAAVCASASVPILFEPAQKKKQRFVDGALSSPVPVGVLRDMGIQKIISVNLYHKNEYKNKNFTFTSNALNSLRIPLYNLARHDVKNADICLNPDISMPVKAVSHFKLREYLSPFIADKIISIGRKETERKLDDIFKMIK